MLSDGGDLLSHKSIAIDLHMFTHYLKGYQVSLMYQLTNTKE